MFGGAALSLVALHRDYAVDQALEDMRYDPAPVMASVFTLDPHGISLPEIHGDSLLDAVGQAF